MISGIIVDEKTATRVCQYSVVFFAWFYFLQGTISDQTGAFNIKSNETKGILPISSVGYSTILLPCTSSNMGTIQLYSDYTLVHIMLSCEVM